ncbi:MAG TPA: ABC transporter substrate-binding protein [Acidimicrobiales bacterium]|nr:ABC transporter substrate-binding protein [Acidimicrobiales bacterium]
MPSPTAARSITAAAAAVALAATMAACGSSGTKTSSSGTGGTTTSTSGGTSTAKQGGTASLLQGSFPDSLDPQYGYTTQAVEADAISYEPLLTYSHTNGTPKLIPDLATALPQVSADGLTYTLNLRSGLTYNDGTPVKASDFAYAIERMIKLNWGGDSFITNYVAGASDYAGGKATSISGITTDDASGAITIKLSQAYGAFPNVLAFPAAALVPSSTPMTVESNTPPVGIGPYTIKNVVPNVSYSLVKNPGFAKFNIPGVPTGNLDQINVTIESNNQTEAQQVLSNQSDVFDPFDTLPPALVSQVKSQAADRFKTTTVPQSYYVFFNTKTAPFNNEVARQAVDLAFDRTATARLASGFLQPACYFLPPGIPGHPTASCPEGDVTQSPSAANVAKAKSMIQSAGLAGTAVTVWSETKSPRQEWMQYYTQLLNDLGFKATLKVIANATYFQTIGNASTNPQTGFADWDEDFPDPSDFYLLLDARSIQPVNNENFGNVDDPHIQSELLKLEAIPSTQLSTTAPEWASLDQYVTQHAFILTFGYQTTPLFTSDRIDQKSIVFSGSQGLDLSSLALK